MMRVVAGFPGVGKTFYSTRLCPDHSTMDSDSSRFCTEDEYLDHIRDAIAYQRTKTLFVSTHPFVLDGLLRFQQAGDLPEVAYYLIYPQYCCKREYLERYQQRGSPSNFIQLIDEFWYPWLFGLHQRPGEHYAAGALEDATEGFIHGPLGPLQVLADVIFRFE